MEIIPFPGARKSPGTKKIKKIQVVPVKTDSIDRLCVSEIEYTCYHCKNKSSLKVEGMIFKTIEFYCESCGTSHKVTNPAFSKNTKQN